MACEKEEEKKKKQTSGDIGRKKDGKYTEEKEEEGLWVNERVRKVARGCMMDDTEPTGSESGRSSTLGNSLQPLVYGKT